MHHCSDRFYYVLYKPPGVGIMKVDSSTVQLAVRVIFPYNDSSSEDPQLPELMSTGMSSLFGHFFFTIWFKSKITRNPELSRRLVGC